MRNNLIVIKHKCSNQDVVFDIKSCSWMCVICNRTFTEIQIIQLITKESK